MKLGQPEVMLLNKTLENITNIETRRIVLECFANVLSCKVADIEESLNKYP